MNITISINARLSNHQLINNTATDEPWFLLAISRGQSSVPRLKKMKSYEIKGDWGMKKMELKFARIGKTAAA